MYCESLHGNSPFLHPGLRKTFCKLVVGATAPDELDLLDANFRMYSALIIKATILVGNCNAAEKYLTDTPPELWGRVTTFGRLTARQH